EIQAQNLDQRLDIKASDVELRSLIDTLNEMMERLHITFRNMEQFTADASHELKTPLTIMAGTLEVALNHDRQPAEYREAIQTALTEIERMSHIVNQLLLLSTLDKGAPNPRSQPLELGKVVAEMVELMEPMMEENKLKLSMNVAAQPRIAGDPVQIS